VSDQSPTTLLSGLLDDLEAESDQLAGVVDELGAGGWRRLTPAPGWSVATQVAHLAWTDEVAVVAARSIEGDEAKAAWDAILTEAIADPTGYVDRGAEQLARLPREEVLERWIVARHGLRQALEQVPAGQRLPWFGPPMSPASMATARFMETWAHSLDVYDAYADSGGQGRPEPTDRIRHVAHLGVRTRDFAFSVHGEKPPAEEFRIELTAPSGDLWTWGPEDADQIVSGSAYDFCLLVTQRVHRGDTNLVAVGRDADHWLDIAQAFAGPPGDGRVVAGG
jgi:uncharacterized protein (TIGR03084 family)